MPQQLVVRSDKDTHFTTTLAQHQYEAESLTSGVNQAVIKAVSLQSDQNLDWGIYFLGSTNSGNYLSGTDLDLNKLSGIVTFATTDGLQISATGGYCYSKTDLHIPYKDEDGTRQIHVALVNRNATAKNWTGGGEVVLGIGLDVQH